MALGDTNSYKGKNDYHPTVFGYQFSNSEAKVDSTSLTFNWWNKMLKLSIAPKLNNNGDYSQYDHKNAISVYIGVQSAKAIFLIANDFLDYLEKSFTDESAPEYNRAFQLNSGILIFSSGEFIGKKKTPCVIIAKIDKEGKIESSYAYEFKINTLFSVEGFNQKTGKYTTNTEPFSFIEIGLFIESIDQYIKAVSNMVAASVVNELQPMRNEINKISEKLGVSNNRGNGNSTRTSYFNNQSGASESNPTSSTLDEIENM